MGFLARGAAVLAEVAGFRALPGVLLAGGGALAGALLSPSSISWRMAPPRLRIRFAKAQSSMTFTSDGVIMVVMRSVFISLIVTL